MARATKDMADADGVLEHLGNPNVAVRLGRGNVGGSTNLDAQIQMALAAGRDPIILDGARNPSLSGLYPGKAIVPESAELPDVKAAITRGINMAAEERRPMALDLGGGQDHALASYMRDLELIEFCQEVGLNPVAHFYLGPDLDDLRHAAAIWEDGYFRPERTFIWMNEGVLRSGQTPKGAFDPIRSHPDFEAMVRAGARPVYFRPLACMAEIRRLGLTLNQAAQNEAGKDGKRIGLADAFTTKRWLRGIKAEAAEVRAGEWLL